MLLEVKIDLKIPGSTVLWVVYGHQLKRCLRGWKSDEQSRTVKLNLSERPTSVQIASRT